MPDFLSPLLTPPHSTLFFYILLLYHSNHHNPINNAVTLLIPSHLFSITPSPLRFSHSPVLFVAVSQRPSYPHLFLPPPSLINFLPHISSPLPRPVCRCTTATILSPPLPPISPQASSHPPPPLPPARHKKIPDRLFSLSGTLIKEGGVLLSRIALQYHRRRRA